MQDRYRLWGDAAYNCIAQPLLIKKVKVLEMSWKAVS